MKTKIFGLILILATLGVKSSIAQYAPSTTGHQLDRYPDATPYTLSLTGDEDGFSSWDSNNHGVLGTNASITESGPDVYRKRAKGTDYVTRFFVRYKAHPPTLSGSGGNLQSGIYHVPQGTPVTVTVADSYFQTRNFFGTGATLLGSNQGSYTVNGTGTVAYTWIAQDEVGNQDTHSFTICWDAPAPTTYTVSFDADGGSPSPANQTVNDGQKATEPTAPTKSGYDFDGWYNGATKWNFSTMTVTSNLTLKAKWTAIAPTTYTVSFDADGGSPSPANQTVNDGQKATEPTAPTKSGYDFDGWYNGGTKWNFSTMTVTSNLTLKAKWTAVAPTTYTVTFDVDGGSPSPANQTVNAGQKATEPTEPTKSGYNFDGWYNGGTKWNFSTMTVTGNLTLKAKWTAVAPTTYTLTVNKGSGSGSYASGAVVSITANIPPSGKQFKNWTTSNGGTFANANAASTTFTMPSNAVIITANYEDVTRPPSSDNRLGTLSLGTGITLTPAFNANVLSYTAEVGYEVTTIAVTATAADNAATVVVTGADNLTVGANTVTITVTAGNGTQRTYTVIVTHSDIPDGIEEVATAHVWAYGNTLYIKAIQSGVAYVYTVTGNIAKVVSYYIGYNTITLPAGVYIVRTENKTIKIVMRQ
jgi:uncharacterized repeat protein (TIGR02543 family)